jgi:ABC-type Mn2+/Zn2+ transport system permease subunit
VEGNIFQYDFIIKGLLGAVFASITAGLAGSYIVSRRMVFLSGGITHASFGGIGIGYFFGFNPVVGAAIFGILSALGVEYLSVKQKSGKILPLEYYGLSAWQSELSSSILHLDILQT